MAPRRHGSAHAGFTLVELLVAVGTIGIIAAIAIPGIIRARIAANETSALASLRVIHTSEATFASECGGGGYAQLLADLVRPSAGSSHAFISPDLATDPSTKDGYVIRVAEENVADAAVVLAAGGS